MPVVVACPKCKKKYHLPDGLLGKPIKCKACETQFKAPARKPAGAGSGQPPAQNPAQLAAQQKAQALAQQRALELKRLGVEGSIQRAPDIFAGPGPMRGTPDPLANHVIEDPGFGDGSDAIVIKVAKAKPNDPLASMYANPALAPVKKKLTDGLKKKKKKVAWHGQLWFRMIAIFVPLFVIAIVISQFEWLSESTNGLVSWVLCGILGIAGFCISIWGLKIVYETTPEALQVLLCLFVPGYIIYYIIVHWEPMKPYAFALLASLAIAPLAIASLVFSGALNQT